jgi:hypothetical protein
MAGRLHFAERSIDDLLRASVQVDFFSGSAVAAIALPMSFGRTGMHPKVSLVYRSGTGNSPLGVGWSLDCADVVSIDTQHGVPRYDGSDGYVAFGGVELVRYLDDGAGPWIARSVSRSGFRIETFRPVHVERPVRVERWTSENDGTIHWRVRGTGGEVSILGRAADGTTRVADPRRPERVYRWLLEAVYDAIRYEYVADDLTGVTTSDVSEVARVRTPTPPAQSERPAVLGALALLAPPPCCAPTSR